MPYVFVAGHDFAPRDLSATVFTSHGLMGAQVCSTSSWSSATVLSCLTVPELRWGMYLGELGITIETVVGTSSGTSEALRLLARFTALREAPDTFFDQVRRC